MSNFMTGFVVGAAAVALSGYVFLSKSICLFGSCTVF